LAQAQQLLSDLNHEINELRKIKQREGINMDYLKNVVLQYMTFPINSSERNALIPVLAMLLQFSPKEMMEIQKSVRDPIWGTRPVKEVKRVENRPPPLPAAVGNSGSRPPAASSGGRPLSSMDSSSHSAPAAMTSSTNQRALIPSSSNSSITSTPNSNHPPQANKAGEYQPPSMATTSRPSTTNNNNQNNNNGKLQVTVPVNHDFFIQNENLTSVSKEFPSMSFDLGSPIRTSLNIGDGHANPQRPVAGENKNNHSLKNNNEIFSPPVERKDSDRSENNDEELRRKLNTITSDVLDLSLSEDNPQQPPMTHHGGGSGNLARNYMIAQNGPHNSNNSQNTHGSNSNFKDIPTFAVNYSSSSTSLHNMDNNHNHPSLAPEGGKTPPRGVIRQTISETSIDEQVFATSSKAL
jgi:hypothetical protein